MTVTLAIRALIRLLPGSWGLVFSNPAKGNDRRQELVQLPGELEPLISAGERDQLIERLHYFGMAESRITEVTGASLYRIRGILARLAAARRATAARSV